MLRAVVFDLDGTIVDSRRDIAASANAALRAVGLPERSEDEIAGFVGEGSRRLIERAVAPRADLADLAHTAWMRHYGGHLLDTTRAYPGVRELLDRLSCPLAVHTNKPGDFARAILAGLGLAVRFARVVGSGDGPAKKPDPEGARLLLRALGVAAGDAVYVGDSRIDVATARAAGIPFLGAGWGLGGARELTLAGAETIARTVADLEGLLVAHRDAP